MTDVLVLDRGEGKTIGLAKAILEADPFGTGLLLTPTAWQTRSTLEAIARESRESVILHRAAGHLVLPNGRLVGMVEEGLEHAIRGYDRSAPIWIDNADLMEHGIRHPALMGRNVVLATGSPPAPWREVDAAWTAAIEWQREQEHRAALGDKRRGEEALIYLGAIGHRVEGIDAETFGRALRKFKARPA